MCCVPLGCMKFLVITMASIMILVGAAVIGAAVYSRSNQLMIYVGDSKAVFVVGLIFGIVLILICIIGIWGACQKNRCCLLIFGIVLFAVMIVLIALSAIIFVVRDNSQEYFEDYKCESGNKLIREINEAQQLAEQLFCVKDVCPCHYQYPPLNPQMATTTGSGPQATQDCPQFPDDKKAAAGLVGAVQYLFNCRGICKTPSLNIFYFSNINNHKGIPDNELCSEDIWSFVKNSTGIAGGICIAMAVISFLAFLSLCGICCHPKRDQYWESSGDRI